MSQSLAFSAVTISASLFVATLLPLPSEASESAAALPVRVASIVHEQITNRVSTYGTLSPKTEELSFKIAGRIATFEVEEGAQVSAGELLAKLEIQDAKDALSRQKVELEQAQRSFKRMQTLHKNGSIQRSQLEDTDALLEQVRIAYEQAQLNLDRCYLRAPSDGLILKEFLDSRTTVGAGQPIFSFQGRDEEWVTKVDLTDRNAFALGEGAQARIRFAPYPGVDFTGKLTKLARVANPMDALYTAEVTIATGGYPLRPGMVSEVDLYQTSEQRFATLPFDALVDLRGHQGKVYLLNSSGEKAVEREVTIVAVQGTSVAVKQTLEGFSRVVVRGQVKLSDGSPVRIIE